MPTKIRKRGVESYQLTVSSGYDNKGKQILHSKTVKASSPREAEKQYGLFLAEIQKGQIATSGKLTLTQFYQYWKSNYAQKNHQATTLAYNDNLYERIDAALGKKRLDKIEPKHLLAFYSNLAEPAVRKDKKTKPLSGNTIRKHHVLIHSLLEKAVQWQFIPYNPADRVEPPKAARTIKAIYDQDQLGLFLQLLEDQAELKYKAMVYLALTGGLRREEIFALCWKHIDFTTNTLRIEQASVYTPSTGIVLKETKNKSSNRAVTIPSIAMELLKQHKTAQSAKRLKLGGSTSKGGKWQGAEEANDDRLFTQWNGKPAHPDSFYTWLDRFTSKNDLLHISPHAFRHMAATYLIAGGTDIRTVSGKLGHSQTSTTMNTYSHLLKTAEQETADKMESFLQQTTKLAKETQKKQAK